MAEIKHRTITLAYLKSALNYDAGTGSFTWAITKSPKAVAGTVAGMVRKTGYRVIAIDGDQYRASRLAWFYVYGEFPSKLIDHINRNKADDRIANLRVASHAENAWNAGPTKRNTSGYRGVCRTKWGWQSYMMLDGKCQNVGSFSTAAEAAAAYNGAAKKYRGEFAGDF